MNLSINGIIAEPIHLIIQLRRIGNAITGCVWCPKGLHSHRTAIMLLNHARLFAPFGISRQIIAQISSVIGYGQNISVRARIWVGNKRKRKRTGKKVQYTHWTTWKWQQYHIVRLQRAHWIAARHALWFKAAPSIQMQNSTKICSLQYRVRECARDASHFCSSGKGTFLRAIAFESALEELHEPCGMPMSRPYDSAALRLFLRINCMRREGNAFLRWASERCQWARWTKLFGWKVFEPLVAGQLVFSVSFLPMRLQFYLFAIIGHEASSCVRPMHCSSLVCAYRREIGYIHSKMHLVRAASLKGGKQKQRQISLMRSLSLFLGIFFIQHRSLAYMSYGNGHTVTNGAEHNYNSPAFQRWLENAFDAMKIHLWQFCRNLFVLTLKNWDGYLNWDGFLQ